MLYEQRQSGDGRAKQQRWRVLQLLSAMKSRLRDTFLEADARRGRVQEQKDVEMDKIEFADGDVPKVDADVHRRHLDQLTQELHVRKSMQEKQKDIKLKIA
ncbi:hypothetical protein PR002_g5507 [Phytophthora rubi]|uniref:Uncharacterized protein n=1 Tax=Phytophthora rubi TaxID=129364 RepID=A0A6A3NEH6_9STRA|nr:hypothetical protein PR002_g5507 [Phytophthora rubi]